MKSNLEEHYRAYQYELARESLGGRYGALSVTSMVVCVNMAAAYAKQIAAYIRAETPGSIERLLNGIPMTAFVFYHQFCVHLSGTCWDTRASQRFVVHFTLLYAFTEMLTVLTNESFPDHEGCPAFRYRCPYTFSSPKFAARGVVLAAIIISHLIPCMPFKADQ